MDDDYLPPQSAHVALSAGAGGGLASLLIGCALLLSACVLMVFNVILFTRGLWGIPRELALLGGAVGACGVAALGALAVVLALRSWGAAKRSEEPTVLPVAGLAASTVGLVGWIIAGIDLIAILLS